MTLDRRTFLGTAAAGLATGLAGSLLPGRAYAAHSFKHGEFEIVVVSDGHLVLPTSFLAPDAPAAERDAILKTAGQTGEQYRSPLNVTLIRTGKDVILIDMGSGDRFMPTAGKLWDNLKAAGIDKDSITKVVFTHGHPDHLWGTVDELDDLVLPKAQYFVPAEEWDFWFSDNATRGLPAERAGFVTGARRNFSMIKDRVTMVKPGQDIVTGLRAIGTQGHTQGHVSIEVAGRTGLVIAGDALTHPTISFAHPEWKPAADHEPARAAETRKQLLDRLASDKMLLVAYHLPEPGAGTVERKDGAYRFIAKP